MRYLTSKKEIAIWVCYFMAFCIPSATAPLIVETLNMKTLIIVNAFNWGIFLLMAAAYWGYPVLNNNDIEVRNILYRFYRKRYAYKDIYKIEICSGSIYHWPCVKIYTTKRKRPYFHCLDCMSPDSIPAFLNELNSHGVKAICTVNYK